MQKRELILNTALRLFLDQGYDQTSLKQIITITGGSLATLYKIFPSKSELFFEAIKYKYCVQIEDLLACLNDNTRDSKKIFFEFAKQYLHFISSSDNIATKRLIIARMYADSKLSLLISSTGKQKMEQYLAEAMQKHLDLSETTSKQFAEFYLGILRSDRFANLLFNEQQITEQHIKDHAKDACEFFFAALNNIKKV